MVHHVTSTERTTSIGHESLSAAEPTALQVVLATAVATELTRRITADLRPGAYTIEPAQCSRSTDDGSLPRGLKPAKSIWPGLAPPSGLPGWPRARISDARPARPPPRPAAEPQRVERRVSCRGALTVAGQRIHVGIGR
jgi:hypothetical protein